MPLHLEISPEKLVNSAQILIPFYPIPTPEKIDEILSLMCKTFSIPFTVESDAKQIWRNRTRQTSTSLLDIPQLAI